MSATGGFPEDVMFIATLIAKERLARGDISAAEDVLGTRGFAWIDEDRAGDFVFSGDPGAARRGLEGLIEGVDVIVQPQANRRKRLLVADMDSTMIEQECIDELADAVGIKAEVAAITARAMNGELNFEDALRTRVKLLKGLSRGRIEEVRRERITFAPGGRTLVQTMKTHGAFMTPTLSVLRAIADVCTQSGFPTDRIAKVNAVLDSGIKAVEIAQRAGIPIAYGTDLVAPMQDRQLDEFRLRSEVVSPIDMLRSATLVADQLVRLEGEVQRPGTIGTPAPRAMW